MTALFQPHSRSTVLGHRGNSSCWGEGQDAHRVPCRQPIPLLPAATTQTPALPNLLQHYSPRKQLSFFQKKFQMHFPKIPGFILTRKFFLRDYASNGLRQRLGTRPQPPGCTPTSETRQPWPGQRLTREGIHECGQRPVQHLEEGVSAGVPLRAAQDRMLQDVGVPLLSVGVVLELHTGDIAYVRAPQGTQPAATPPDLRELGAGRELPSPPFLLNCCKRPCRASRP